MPLRACSDKYFLGWTPETEDGTDTTGDEVDLLSLKKRYLDLLAAGREPKDTMNGLSGLKAGKGSKAAVAAKGGASQSSTQAAEVSKVDVSTGALAAATANLGMRPVRRT